MREPIAADRFYEGDPVKLYEQVQSYLSMSEKKDIKLAIIPHAGYYYSGKCAGKIYSLFDRDEVESVVLIGPNHSGRGPKVAVCFQNFLMPFGKMENDPELGRKILEMLKLDGIECAEDDFSHKHEHSLEVQLPFIESVFGKKTRIVPIILRDMEYEECMKTAGLIFDAIYELKRKTKIIISSDFTHYGKDYNFLPFNENIKSKLYELDKKSIDLILGFDSKGFYEYALKETTICGVFGITLGIELARLSNSKKAENICFYNSGDITNDYENSVNYAGIIFE